MLQWILSCMYLFELWFCPDICPGVELLDHTAALFLVFWETSMVFSVVAVPIYIPTNRVGALLFLHTFSSIYCLWTFWWCPFWLLCSDNFIVSFFFFSCCLFAFLAVPVACRSSWVVVGIKPCWTTSELLHCSFDLLFSNKLVMLSISSCAFWPSVCLLWRNVCLDLLTIFSLGFIFWYKVHEMFVYFGD